MITLTLIANDVGIVKQGLEKLGHAHNQCLLLKMKVLIIDLIFLKQVSFGYIYTLDVGIAFGRQDNVLT